MGALAHYLESDGLPTVAIALIREHAERIRPPRALWVPFELGRPLGAPDDAAFQRRVLDAALALFAAEAGPVLVDFPDEAPAAEPGEPDADDLVCPVSFPPPPRGREPTPAERVLDEIARLRPWYDLVRNRTGRTTVGASGLALEEIVGFLDGFVDGRGAVESPIPDVPLASALKLTTDDLAAFYQEAASGRPDIRGSSQRTLRWLWTETSAARLLLRVREIGADAADEQTSYVARRLLVPRAALELL